MPSEVQHVVEHVAGVEAVEQPKRRSLQQRRNLRMFVRDGLSGALEAV
jgi:hypothetical protein